MRPDSTRRSTATMLLPVLLCLAACAALPDSRRTSTVTLPTFAPPPITEKGTVVETLHGIAVADPYRWLEDPTAPATRAWAEGQNAVTRPYLAALPHRDAFRRRLESLIRFERWSPPFEEGGRWWFTWDDGKRNQPVLQATDSPDAAPTTIIDPNGWSSKGTKALAGFVPDPTGKLLAYAIAENGSDWTTWYVKNLATGKDLDDRIEWVKFSTAAWLRDGSGFFYSRYDAPKNDDGKFAEANKNQRVWFHKIGTPQSADVLVYERTDKPDWGFIPMVTRDGRWLLLETWQGASGHNAIWAKDLSTGGFAGGTPFVPLAPDMESMHAYVAHDGARFTLLTNKDAERGRLVVVDAARLDAPWTTLVPESDATLEAASCVGGKLFLRRLRDARHEIVTAELATGRTTGTVRLPSEIGSVGGFGGKREANTTFYSFANQVTAPTVWKYDTTTGASTPWRTPNVAFDPADFETRQVFVTSKDGTRVPMFLAGRKGAFDDGPKPTLLYGYGGFNVSLTPEFSAGRLAWIEAGGLFAMACLRGGGEYGEAWHAAGTKTRKQNVFDDFIACAEWLIRERHTTTPQLGIQGESNGGLLVGACLTQRPDLFGCALPGVGVMDMLRFHKFTIGWAWISDYGNPDDPREFAALRAYSPVHNLKPGTAYPPTLVSTANTDDRVVPAHSFKFAAALQAAQSGPAPCLIRIEMDAGHGAGKPLNKILDEAADRWAFLAAHTGLPLAQ